MTTLPDWHLSSTRRILNTLAEILNDIDFELQTAEQQYQIDDAIDQAENVLGLAFVAAQVYITSTIGKLARTHTHASPINKHESVKEFGEPIKGSKVTDVQLADAAANYYKHHDERDDITKPDRHTRTLKVLHDAGVDTSEPYPCVQVGELLFPPPSPQYLQTLLHMLTRWRERQVAAIGNPSPQAGPAT